MNESGGAAKIRIENEEQLRQWLDELPRKLRAEAAVMLAARAASRVLPMAATGIPLHGDEKSQRFFVALAAVFRTNAWALIGAKYPHRAYDFFRAVAHSTTIAAATTVSAVAASVSAHASAEAVYAVLAAASYDPVGAASAAISAATYAVDAANANTAVPIWAALSADVDALARGEKPETLAGRELWPGEMPAVLSENWRRLRAALPTDENWDVWIGWYEDVLAGRSRGEDYELVFASVPDEEWDKGPAAANAWIKANLPKEPVPKALDNVPSAFTFGWNASARISIIAGPQNQPVFPYASNQADHATQLAACRSLAQRLVDDLKASRLNCSRPDYREGLQRYLADLPIGPDMGNLVLADAEYRILRDLFAAEAGILSAPFASRLRIWTQQHIGLRTFYPEVERFYDTVKSGRLERPLPEDAVAGFEQVVREYTPRCFEPEVSAGLREVEREPPQITIAPEDIAAHESAPIQPQPDPWGELEPRKSRSFSIGGAINGLWKVFLKGKDVKEAKDGWGEVADKLRPHASSILEWLQDFINKNGS